MSARLSMEYKGESFTATARAKDVGRRERFVVNLRTMKVT